MPHLLSRALSAVKGYFGGSGMQQVVWQNGTPRVLPSKDRQIDQNTIVHACLESICNAFVVPALVSATVGADRLEVYDSTSNFAKRAKVPAPGQLAMSGKRMLKAAVADYRLTGNAYFEVIYDGAGDVLELHWLPSWIVTPRPVAGRNNQLDHYDVLRSGSRTQRLETRDVVHVADGIDPENPLRGRSAMRSLLLQVMTDNEADSYSAEVIRDPAIAGWAVLPTGDDPGKENAEYVEERIKNKFGKGGRGGVFVPAFRADVKNIGFSPEQLALDKLRRLPEERISAVMNVPAIVAGLGAGLDRSTFANMESAQRYFARYGMLPLWREFADAFTAQLPDEFPKGSYAAFDLTRVPELEELVGDRWARVTNAYQDGVLKRGEARQALGYVAGSGDDVYFTDVSGANGATAKQDDLKSRIRDRRRVSDALAQQEAGDGG